MLVDTASRPTALYCITTKDAPSKFYFGISVHPETRMKQHIAKAVSGYTSKLSGAIRKRGAEAFKLVILKWHAARGEASTAEQQIIEAYGGPASRALWNSTSGGDAGFGYDGAVMEKIRQAQLATYSKPGHSEQRSKTSLKTWSSRTDRAAHSRSVKAAMTPEHLESRGKAHSLARRTVDALLRNSFFIEGVSVTDDADKVVFFGVREAMRSGYDESGIYKSLNGKAKMSGGRKWSIIPNHSGFAARADLFEELMHGGFYVEA